VLSAILIDERRIVIRMPRAALSREILAYGIKSQVAAAGDMLLMQSGKLIAGILIGPTAAGVYELASRLAIGAQVFGAASTGALIPHLTRSYINSGMAGVSREYEQLTQRNTAVAVTVPFAMAATAYSAIPLWLGGADGQVIMVLIALLPGIAINVSTGVCTSTLMAVGRPGVVAVVCVSAGILQSAIAVAAGYAYGFVGIAVAFALGVPTAKFVGLWYMQGRVGIPTMLYFRGVRGPYAAGFISTFIALPIGVLAAPQDRDSAVWPFFASALVFSAVYAAVGWGRGYLPRIALPGSRARASSQQPEGR
jgi:O-antigen/teichoic acid export membrane protein